MTDARRLLRPGATYIALLVGLALSAWATPARAQYCAAPTTDPSDGFLDGFQLDGERRSNPTGNAGYFDGTAQPAVGIDGGQAYGVEIFMVAPPGAGQFDYELAVFVDYNNDQDFSDPGELEGSIGLLMTGGAFAWSFTLPLSPPNGITGDRRMRLVMLGNPNTGPHACPGAGAFQGETEDWTLSIVSTQVCGNGVAEGTEDCDLGAANGAAGNCCSASCSFRAAGSACTDDGLECTSDVCTGASAVCTHPNRVGSCTDDGNVCTDDVCSAGACTHPNNPAPCAGDGVECTADVCSAGACTHPALGLGTPCGSPTDTACSNPDTCDGAGACQDNDETAGFACGDPSDTGCTNPDTCDGNGVCLVNHEAVGFACGDPSATTCTAPDSCNGGGACLPNNAADLTPCGDASDTECTDPDSCGGGICLPRHAVDLTPCSDDGNDCTADRCNAGACAHPSLPADTACGDPSDTDCTDADTCNGFGVCLDNHETDGTVCTEDGNACTGDACEGGTCLHPDLPAGTSCGDPTDADCTDPDTCDGAGVCLDNHAADDTACTDDGNDCTGDLCSGGACDHPILPADTACGDGSDTECTDPDTCDDAGNCLPHHEADDVQCAPDASDCTSDVCQGGACAHPNLPADTACGSGADTECTDPDTCDGSGLCLSHHTAAGTTCGDGSDTECTDPDACDGAGACLGNHAPDDQSCADDGLFCTGDESCQAGLCTGSGNPCDEATQTCEEELAACMDRCGNGAVDAAGEACDDGDLDDLDGCSATCTVEPGWVCTEDPGPGSTCTAGCGDGEWAEGAEACDDGNAVDGDGCSAECAIEAGWDCPSAEPGEATACTEVCGDGQVVGTEQCDDENDADADGCFDCLIEDGWVCDAGEPSVCELELFCGNGEVGDGEDCDDGNADDGDGCSAACDVEAGWLCDDLEPTLCLPDGDGDGIHDLADNCPAVANVDQADMDSDGQGDVCDDDVDGDGLLNDEDDAPFDPRPVLAGGGGCSQGGPPMVAWPLLLLVVVPLMTPRRRG